MIDDVPNDQFILRTFSQLSIGSNASQSRSFSVLSSQPSLSLSSLGLNSVSVGPGLDPEKPYNNPSHSHVVSTLSICI
jgi:hypothetical protein